MAASIMIPSYFGGFGPPARFRQRKNARDALAYDFRAARVNLTTPNTVAESSIHLLMCALGSGVVTIHAAYMECGIFTALFLNIILSLIVSYCICMLVWSAQKLYGRVHIAKMSYPDVAEATFLLAPCRVIKKIARCFRYVVEVTLGVHAYGMCIVVIIMIARNLKQLVEGSERFIEEGVDGSPSLQVYILSLMIPCILVCMVLELKYLAPIALAADFYAVAVALVAFWYSMKNEFMPWERPWFKSVQGAFQFFGVCVFTLETVSIAIPLENNMDRPRQFHRVVLFSMPIITVLMMTIGFCGYWSYGELSTAPVTIYFPYSPFAIQLKVFLCLVLYVKFAMCFYVGFDLEWFYLKRNHLGTNYWFWERFYRSFHVIVITLLGFAWPNIRRLMGMLGSMFTAPTLFIYPPLLELILDWDYPGLGRYKWRLLKCILLIIFGLSVMIGGIVGNILGIIDEIYQIKDEPYSNANFVRSRFRTNVSECVYYDTE